MCDVSVVHCGAIIVRHGCTLSVVRASDGGTFGVNAFVDTTGAGVGTGVGIVLVLFWYVVEWYRAGPYVGNIVRGLAR